jgi:pimeloyl-ACP methyl ester carboxylesterase
MIQRWLAALTDCLIQRRPMVRVLAGCFILLVVGCASPKSELLRPELHRDSAEEALWRTNRAWTALVKDQADPQAALEYTTGTREFVHAMRRSAPPSAWAGEHATVTPDERLFVKFDRGDARSAYDPQIFDRILLAETKRPNKAVPTSQREGLGVPLLARVREDRKTDDRRTGYPNHGQFIPLTAWLEYSARAGDSRATLHLSDPREQTSIRVGRSTQRLAADFGAAAHAMLAPGNFVKLAFKGLLDPERFVPERGVYLGEPYRRDKIPVILTHGLNSDPHIWENLATAIMADPELGRRFQIWYFAYPTGEPALNSARAFRRSLEEVRSYYDPQRRDIASRDVVLVGHSMGGLLSRLLVTDSADAFHRAYFTKPLAELNFRPRVKEEIQAALVFRPVPGVTRAVFIATPHRGSGLASGYIGQAVRSLVSLPATSIRSVAEIVTLNEHALNPLIRNLRRLGATSLDTLSPGHPYFAALETRPVTVPFHSLIGDRGSGLGSRSSDGIVPYASSHLAGAQSERFVPYGHGCVERRETVEEVTRILRQHLSQSRLR